MKDFIKGVLIILAILWFIAAISPKKTEQQEYQDLADQKHQRDLSVYTDAANRIRYGR